MGEKNVPSVSFPVKELNLHRADWLLSLQLVAPPCFIKDF